MGVSCPAMVWAPRAVSRTSPHLTARLRCLTPLTGGRTPRCRVATSMCCLSTSARAGQERTSGQAFLRHGPHCPSNGRDALARRPAGRAHLSPACAAISAILGGFPARAASLPVCGSVRALVAAWPGSAASIRRPGVLPDHTRRGLCPQLAYLRDLAGQPLFPSPPGEMLIHWPAPFPPPSRGKAIRQGGQGKAA